MIRTGDSHIAMGYWGILSLANRHLPELATHCVGWHPLIMPEEPDINDVTDSWWSWRKMASALL